MALNDFKYDFTKKFWGQYSYTYLNPTNVVRGGDDKSVIGSTIRAEMNVLIDTMQTAQQYNAFYGTPKDGWLYLDYLRNVINKPTSTWGEVRDFLRKNDSKIDGCYVSRTLGMRDVYNNGDQACFKYISSLSFNLNEKLEKDIKHDIAAAVSPNFVALLDNKFVSTVIDFIMIAPYIFFGFFCVFLYVVIGSVVRYRQRHAKKRQMDTKGDMNTPVHIET